MIYILSGLVLFFGPHFFSYTQARQSLLTKLGEGPYKGLYSLASLAGLILMGLGYWQARSGPLAAASLWSPPEWAFIIAPPMVFFAFVLIAASHTKGHLKLWVRHPMSAGMFLWALAHLLSGGKTATTLIFGSFLALSVVDIAIHLARGQNPQFSPRISGDFVALLGGAVAFGLFALLFHPYVLNLPVLF